MEILTEYFKEQRSLVLKVGPAFHSVDGGRQQSQRSVGRLSLHCKSRGDVFSNTSRAPRLVSRIWYLMSAKNCTQLAAVQSDAQCIAAFVPIGLQNPMP